MILDLSKLSPAPWVVGEYQGRFTNIVHHSRQPDGTAGCVCSVGSGEADAKAIALARNAFDVMMRRGWAPRIFSDDTLGVEVYPYKSRSDEGNLIFDNDQPTYPDPFTALVEADRRCRENTEKGEVNE